MTSQKDASPIAISKRFILASASPRRRDLLAQIGYVPDLCCPAELDEAPRPREAPKALAERLAYEKAQHVVRVRQDQHPTDDPELILAADTVVAVGRRVLPKPADRAEAARCLDLLSGRSHRVYTGVSLWVGTAFMARRCVETRVKMKSLSRQEINDYLDCGEWQGKAGGYAIQGGAARFVSGLIGSYSNVVGLPLYEVDHLLRAYGVVPKMLINT